MIHARVAAVIAMFLLAASPAAAGPFSQDNWSLDLPERWTLDTGRRPTSEIVVAQAGAGSLVARSRGALTETETNQLRQAATDLGKRLKLYINFAEARLLATDQVRADPKSADGRGKLIHDRLADFTGILDEASGVLDLVRIPSDRYKKPSHKGIEEFIAATNTFDRKLKALHAAAQADPQTRKERADFQYVLEDAEDALKSSRDLARECLKIE
ncbi:MAG TPA: hypothetical protein VKT70_09955 [Stellaceae bacterium]|nr:hypothetical protein [Stellaceae bacterium]